MRLRVFEVDVLIGEAAVVALDPPMGVVIAKFIPTHAYDVSRHASVIDEEFAGDHSDVLRVETEIGLIVKSVGISILYFPTLNERELHILGIYEPPISAFSEPPPTT